MSEEKSLTLVFVDADDTQIREEVWDLGYPLYHYRILLQVRLGERLPPLSKTRVFVDGRPIEVLPDYIVPPSATELRMMHGSSAREKRYMRAN